VLDDIPIDDNQNPLHSKKRKSDGSLLKVKSMKEDGNIMRGSENSSLALVPWSSGHSSPTRNNGR
jgi:hypothetical protein